MLQKQEVIKKIVDIYHNQLIISDHAKDYLRKRGITTDSMEKFKLGYADGLLLKRLKMYDLSLLDMLNLGFITNKNGRYFETGSNRICLHTRDLDDNISFITFRAINPDNKLRYINLRGSKIDVINTQTLLNENLDYLIITEGFFDCIVLDQLDFNAIGLAGCNSTPDLSKYFHLLAKPKKIIIMFDKDANNSGYKSACKLGFTLYKNGIKNVYIADIYTKPVDKMDINSLLMLFGRKKTIEHLNSVLKNSVTELIKTKEFKYHLRQELSLEEQIERDKNEDWYIKYSSVLTLKPIGKYYKAVCPFHNDSEASFTIYSSSGFAKCYGCGLIFKTFNDFKKKLDSLNNSNSDLVLPLDNTNEDNIVEDSDGIIF